MPTVYIRPQVFVDLDEIATVIDEERPRIAHEFLLRVEERFNLLAQFPTMGAACGFKRPLNRDIRSSLVKNNWPYIIFYRPFEDGVEILRVMHGKRDYPEIFSDTLA